MSELSIKITGEEADLIARLVNVVRHVKQSDEAFAASATTSEKAASAAREAARQQATLANEGKRIADNLRKQSENLTDSYDRQSRALHLAHEKNKIDADQLKTALVELDRQHEEQAASNRRAAVEASEAWQTQQREIREGVAVIDRLTAKNKTVEQQHIELKAKIKAAWEAGKISSRQYADGLLQVDAELAKVKTQQKEVSAQTESTFGAGTLKKLGSMATGYLSIQTAVQEYRRELEHLHTEMGLGLSETERLQDARTRLLQVSKGDYEALRKRADAGAINSGVNRDVAAQVLFRARSENFEKDFERVLQLKPLMSPDAAATIAGKTRGLFSNENLSLDEVVSAVVKAAESSDAPIEAISRGLPSVGEGGRQIQSTLAESAAVLSVLSPIFKSTDEAANRLKLLASKLALDESTDNRGFIGGFEALRNMPEGSRKEFLGESTELNSIYAAMQEFLPAIKSMTKEIQNAQGQNLAEQRLQEFARDQSQANLELSQKAKIGREVTAEGAYSATISRNKAFLDFYQAQQNAGNPAFTGARGYLGRRGAEIDNYFNPMADAAARFDPDSDVRKQFEQFWQEQQRTNELLGKMATGQPLITRPGEDK